MNKSEIADVLANSEFFKYLQKNDIADIASICDTLSCQSGDYIFRQGDFGDQLFVVAEGQVFLERSMDVGAHKGKVVLETLGKGRLLGCWSTLLGAPHILMSSAGCKGSTRLLVLKGSQLREKMSQDNALGFNILERLCFLLRDRIQAAYGALEKI